MEDRAKRKRIDTKVDFIVDADVIPAKSVDISESGIAFRTDTPIKVTMRMGSKIYGDVENKTAELVWTRKESDGSTTYGLQFIDAEDGDIGSEIEANPNVW